MFIILLRQICKKYAHLLPEGLNSQFLIPSTAMNNDLLNRAIQKYFPAITEAGHLAKMRKDLKQNIDKVFNNSEYKVEENIKKVITEYENLKRKDNIMTFNDTIDYCIFILKSPKAGYEISQKYGLVIVGKYIYILLP